MKKPLLFCLLMWLVLLALPWTRGRALLDWRGATIEQLSGDRPEWAPLDAPYRPEQFLISGFSGLTGGGEDVPDAIRADGLKVAPQFASIANSSTDRDVLVWCALSAGNAKDVARNFGVLTKRFPDDAALLAWACSAQSQELSMTTRWPGPLCSSSPNWSVQTGRTTSSQVQIDFKAIPQWNALVAQVRRGQKMEPRNGFWWWMEAISLLGARRDEEVWTTLRTGAAKTEIDDHGKDRLLALRQAHIKTQGAVPVIYLLSGEGGTGSFTLYSRAREATRQVSENIMGARLAGRHKTAVEGGRDLMMMGRMLRRSSDDIGVLVAVAIEAIVARNTLPPAASVFTRLPANAGAQALAGHPTSLLLYANELNRKDIALQVTSEINATARARKAVMAKTGAILTSGATVSEGVRDVTVSWAGGSQNTAALLVQTLPVPLMLLTVLSLPLLVWRRSRRDEAFVLPAWTRGLGWSAFALLVLVAAQALFAHLAWQSVYGTAFYKGFDFLIPRLARLLPVWAFAFAACVAVVGALWATVIAARRARGDASVLSSLRGMLSAPDERMGTVNMGPLLQLIALVGAWGLFIVALGAWFYYPQEGALDNSGAATETLHSQYGGMSLALFCLAAIVPAFLFRARNWGVGTYLWGWAQVARRFLVAHLVLATVLYLLLALNGAYWGARFDAEWLKVNTPTTTSNGL